MNPHIYDLTNFPELDIPQEAISHLEIMLSAISKVEKDYLWYKDYIDKNAEEKLKEHLERVFAYEFYHQWRNLLEEKGYKHIFLNAEISKAVKDSMENNHVSTIFPDLVLHGGQNCDDENKQLIACEIKRKENISGAKIKGDIESLINYLSNLYFTKTPFQCGVFILVGTTLDETLKIHNNLKELKEISVLESFSNRILCVCYDFCDKRPILQCESLKTLMSKIP